LKTPLLMHVNNTVFLRDENLVIVDRRYFPAKIIEIICPGCEEVAKAIEDMAVQGAGDIAITAGYGLYLAAREIDQSNSDLNTARAYLLSAHHRLVNTRPTGHHLKALLDKMLQVMDMEQGDWSAQILNNINRAIEKQERRSELTGQWAEQVLKDGDTILTHCFSGPALLYMVKFARYKGKSIEVIATETRPYLQGARLTAWSVSELGIPVTLITDNMAAYCMNKGMISKVFTAADRIAMDGTVANKVGTFQLALAAQYHKLPFYVLGYGGPDRRCLKAEDIPIEIRDPEEVLVFKGERTTGEKVQGFYPAFDLTPAGLVKGIITDRGIFDPSDFGKYWSE